MQFTFNHTNLNVADLEKSIRFYEEALGLKVQRMVAPESGDFKLAFLEDGVSGYLLELTWLKDHPQKYELGENESHICFRVDDFEAAHKKHQEMGCVCFRKRGHGPVFHRGPGRLLVRNHPRAINP